MRREAPAIHLGSEKSCHRHRRVPLEYFANFTDPMGTRAKATMQKKRELWRVAEEPLSWFVDNDVAKSMRAVPGVGNRYADWWCESGGGHRNNALTSLRRQDVALATGAHVCCLDKGRKMRCANEPDGSVLTVAMSPYNPRQGCS